VHYCINNSSKKPAQQLHHNQEVDDPRQPLGHHFHAQIALLADPADAVLKRPFETAG